MYILCSASLAGTAVTTLNSGAFNAGIEALMLAQASNHQAEFAAVMRQLARVTIATRKVTALTAPTLGASSLIFENITQGGTGAGTFISLVGGATTLAVPRGIAWQAGGSAVLTAELIFLSSNGTTAPITVGTTAGTDAADADEWVGSGTGVSAINIDFGFQIATPPDGHLYPINAYVQAQRPRIAITYNDSTNITTANLNPGAISTLTATLAKLADGGVRGAATTYATTGHLRAASLQGGAPGSVVMECLGKAGITIT